MSDQAAKFIMFGLIAIAVAMFFDTTPGRYQINYPKSRNSEYYRLYDPKTGAVYLRQDGEWRAFIEGFGGDYKHAPAPPATQTKVVPDKPVKAVPDSTSKKPGLFDWFDELEKPDKPATPTKAVPE